MVDNIQNPQGKKIATDSSKLSIAQFTSLGISMVNIMLLSRFRTLEEYGTYSQLLMVSAIVVTFFSSGFSQCINYFLANAENPEDRKSFIKNYYFILSISGLLGGIVGVSLIPVLADYFNNEAIKTYFFVLLIYPFANILNNGADRLFIVYKKANQLILFKIRYSITSLLTVSLAVFFQWSFYNYLIVFISVELFFAFLIYFFVYKITNVVPIGFNADICKKIIMFAVPMGLAALVAVINTELNRLIIGGLVDTETLAVYTNAAKELPITVFCTSISAVVMPFVVRNIQNGNNNEAVKLWNHSIKLSAYIMCFFAVAFFVFAPQVISVLYSNKFLSGVWVFRIYLLVLLFRLTYYGMILNAQGSTKIILVCSLISIAINIILCYVFFNIMGVIGPALATVIAVASMNIYQLYRTKKSLGVPFAAIYPVSSILRILVLNIVISVFFFGAQQLAFKFIPLNQNLITIFLGAIWAAVYFIIVRKKFFSIWRKLNR